MDILMKEYKMDGFYVKILAPDVTDNEKLIMETEIKEKVIRVLSKNKAL